jgi:phosphoribosylformylglycinamidine synthase
MKMQRVNVIVRLKHGVLDPQGKTIEHALQSLDFPEVGGVRVGKYIELEVDESLTGDALKERVNAMCDKLLANPVIEDYQIVEA